MRSWTSDGSAVKGNRGGAGVRYGSEALQESRARRGPRPSPGGSGGA